MTTSALRSDGDSSTAMRAAPQRVSTTPASGRTGEPDVVFPADRPFDGVRGIGSERGHPLVRLRSLTW